MEENPYSALLQTIREDSDHRAGEPWLLGRVKSAVPLVVEYGGQEYWGQELLVNPQLLPNQEPVLLEGPAGRLTATADCGAGQLGALEVTGGSLRASGLFGGILAPGDQVALLPSRDCQSFVVVCKVVSG